MRDDISSTTTHAFDSLIEPAALRPERLARMEVLFRHEPVDPAWSRSAEARVRTFVAEIGDGVPGQLRSVECRSRSCRLEIAFDTDQPIDDTLARVAAQLRTMFAISSSACIDLGDGRQVGILFLMHCPLPKGL